MTLYWHYRPHLRYTCYRFKSQLSCITNILLYKLTKLTRTANECQVLTMFKENLKKINRKNDVKYTIRELMAAVLWIELCNLSPLMTLGQEMGLGIRFGYTPVTLTAWYRYCGICVVFPDPVSPSMINTWKELWFY